jgi:dihydrofolate synthase / folylpolyglutamate synthase
MFNYQEAILYLNSFINYERKRSFPYNQLRLKRVRDILSLLGNPHKDIKSIHIAGTKGKGSTAIFIANILKSAGFRTGLYTSPHLHDFRERITINGRLMNKKDLILLTEKMKKVVDKYIKKTGNLPTYFEIYTILAFCYFKLKKIDFMVIETGLGGRLDATNVIKPLICVITPISHEHTGKLGRTLTKISHEKAGIIKRNSVVISAVQPKAVLGVIRETAAKKRSKLFIIGKDVSFEPLRTNGKYQLFRTKGIFRTYNPLKTSLLGRHQLMNATSGIATVEALRFFNTNIPPAAVKKGIKRAKWPGRLEVVSNKPLIVLDGAQNKASAQVLREAVQSVFNYQRLILILGICRDKDIRGICTTLEKISDIIILSKASHPRAAEVERLKKHLPNKKPIYTRKNLKYALELAKSKAKKDDLILITGSLFVVAEARSEILAIKNGEK